MRRLIFSARGIALERVRLVDQHPEEAAGPFAGGTGTVRPPFETHRYACPEGEWRGVTFRQLI